MNNKYAETEIVEIGIQTEINGRDFYNEAAERSKSGKAREIFRHLAGEEEKHIDTFRKILASVHEYEPLGVYPEEYFAYMRALASDYVFTRKDSGKEVARQVKTDNEAVEMGIKFEKDSIIFYENMKKVMLENEFNLVDKLIHQEQEHLKKLIDLKEEL